MNRFFLLLLFLNALVFNSCSFEIQEVDAVATSFYQKMQEQDYEAIKSMIAEEALQTTSWEHWQAALAANQLEYGALENFKCTGTKYADDDKGLRYQLRYEVEYENVTKIEELVFLKVDGQYKLVHYQFR